MSQDRKRIAVGPATAKKYLERLKKAIEKELSTIDCDATITNAGDGHSDELALYTEVTTPTNDDPITFVSHVDREDETLVLDFIAAGHSSYIDDLLTTPLDTPSITKHAKKIAETLKKNSPNNDLKFSSMNQALQHLANITGKTIKVAN